MKIPDIELKNKAMMPQLGLGTYKLTGMACYGAVKEAIALGYRHIDTAEYYCNESEIGAAIKPIGREKLFITSKVWRDNLLHDDVIDACEKTIRNMKSDYLDLYLIHWPNDDISLKETLEAMKYLYDKKHVRSIGVSNFPIDKLKEAMHHSSLPICIDQVEYHVYLNQKDLLLFCRKHDINITAYSPLSRGISFKEPALLRIGKKHRKTAGQVALRWLVQKGIIVIPKGSTKEHIRENMEVFDFNLDEDDLNMIEGLPQHRLVAPDFMKF